MDHIKHVILGLMVLSGISFSLIAADTDNLCAIKGVRVKGSDSYLYNRFRKMITEKDFAWCRTNPPQYLTITWKEPVTFNTNFVRWIGKFTNKSSETEKYATWYGLEYWNGKEWKLCYEIKENDQTEGEYRFKTVTTDKIRFTIFANKGKFIRIRYFKLFLAKEADNE